jgi:hypothetical protein
MDFIASEIFGEEYKLLILCTFVIILCCCMFVIHYEQGRKYV